MQENIRFIKDYYIKFAIFPQMKQCLQPDLNAVTCPPDLSLMTSSLFGIEEIEVVFVSSLCAAKIQAGNFGGAFVNIRGEVAPLFWIQSPQCIAKVAARLPPC